MSSAAGEAYVARNDSKKRLRVFISHASANLEVARRVETTLEVAGFDPCLDHSDIRVGSLLGKELKDAIKSSRVVVLLWGTSCFSKEKWRQHSFSWKKRSSVPPRTEWTTRPQTRSGIDPELEDLERA